MLRVVCGARGALVAASLRTSAAQAVRTQATNAGPTLLELVKQLRKETNAGIADCKEALVAANQDITKAKLILQEQAKKTAAKKAARQALEGQIVAALDADGSRGLLLELNCETDFAAKDGAFITVARDVAKAALAAPKSALPANTRVLDKAALGVRSGSGWRWQWQWQWCSSSCRVAAAACRSECRGCQCRQCRSSDRAAHLPPPRERPAPSRTPLRLSSCVRSVTVLVARRRSLTRRAMALVSASSTPRCTTPSTLVRSLIGSVLMIWSLIAP